MPHRKGEPGEKGEKGERGKTGALSPRKVFWSFIALGIAFTICLAVMSVFITQNHGLARQGQESHTALCALKDDLQRRLAASESFLDANPEGAPPITAAIIRDGIRNQRRTIRALAPIKCDGG